MNTNDLIEQGCELESGTTFSDRLQIVLKDEPLLSFAKRSGVGEGSLRQYLKGSEPGLEKVIAIAKAAGVSVGWLASGEGAPDGTPQPPAPAKRPGETLSNSVAERLRFAVRKLGGLKELAQKSGVAHADIQGYLNGKDPSTKHLAAIGDAARLDINWLLTGKGNLERVEYMNATPGKHVLDDADSSGVAVPLISVTASAGHGAVALDERVEDHIQFSPARLHSMGLNPRESFIISAMGDSMNPLIRSGDMMLCSRADHHIKGRDGIAVVRLEGDLLVKRIQRMPGGKVRLSSENPDYSPFEIALNDGTDFAVLGLVMWAFKRV